VTLQPGQSLTLTATWDPDANPNSPAPDGYYQIGFSDPFDIFSGPLITVGNPPPPSLITVPPNQPVAIVTPITAPNTLTAPAPASSGPIAVTASASQVASHPNAPLRISLTLENVLDQKVHLGQFKKRAEITLLRGSTVVAEVRKRLTISRAENLKPGRSVHLSTDLKIRPSRASLRVLKPGTYTVEVEDGSYSATTTLDIKRP
jgi:hypothetical protein